MYLSFLNGVYNMIKKINTSQVVKYSVSVVKEKYKDLGKCVQGDL
jgi:hypothetical protein